MTIEDDLNHEPSDIRRTESNRVADDLTLANVRLGNLTPEDLVIHRTQLLAQAEFAESKGYDQLARNFRRAAELTGLPNTVLLAVYDKLRPNRSTYAELLSTSQELIARYDAPETGSYIREAAETYRERGLLRSDDI